MRATYRLLARRGFFGRSLDEFGRVTLSAWRQEGVMHTPYPYVLLDFTDPESVRDVKKMSDRDIGGFSTANFDHVPAADGEPAHARFHGSISTELPSNRPEVQRTGFAAWRNKDRGPTLLGRSLWNIDPYRYLALRIRSDGRKYFVNLQTESIVPTDIHQHRLYAKHPGRWETVVINWNDFVRTNYGMVVEPQGEILRETLRTVGIGSTDRQIGPFDLCVQKIWATNDAEGKLENDADAKGRQAEEVEKAY